MGRRAPNGYAGGYAGRDASVRSLRSLPCGWLLLLSFVLSHVPTKNGWKNGGIVSKARNLFETTAKRQGVSWKQGSQVIPSSESFLSFTAM